MPDRLAENNTELHRRVDGAELLAAAVTRRIVVEWRIWLEFICAVMRRRRPSEAVAAELGPGSRFPLHKGAVSSIIIPITVIASCVDVPLIHLLLNDHVSAVLRGPFHVALLVFNAWAIIWIIDDRSAVAHIPHVVGLDTLRLRVGHRLALDVPLSAVRGIHSLKGSPREWMSARGLTRNEVVLVTPMDAPNVLLEIDVTEKAAFSLRARRSAGARRFLAIRVDNAEGFKRALASAC
jgi:hypothetical protein